jgi:hypothetical protein
MSGSNVIADSSVQRVEMDGINEIPADAAHSWHLRLPALLDIAPKNGTLSIGTIEIVIRYNLW